MPKPPRPVEERFWEKVNKSAECWEWTASLTRGGYGQFHVRVNGKWAPRRVHRVAWEFVNGPIPDGLYLCHKCDNRKCLRPDHMFLGTAADNSKDAAAKGRTYRASTRTHCRKGHSNWYVYPSGRRHCVTCKDEKRLARKVKTPRSLAYGSDYCSKGHLRSEKIYADGFRKCQTCMAERGRRSYEKRKAAKNK